MLFCLHLPLIAQLALLLAVHGTWPVLVRATVETNASPADVLQFRMQAYASGRTSPWRRWLFAAVREQRLDQLPALYSVMIGAVPFRGARVAQGQTTTSVRQGVATSLPSGFWLAGFAAAAGALLVPAVNKLLPGLAVSFLAGEALVLAILLYSLSWPAVVTGYARPAPTGDRGNELERAG